VAIGPEQSPLALLSVTRGPREEPFHADDLAALQVLADQAASWLAGIDDAVPTVIDLEPERRTPQHTHRVAGLLSELDLLRSRLDGLTLASAGGRALAELEESQWRLTDALSEVFGGPSSQDDAVAVGSWTRGPPRAAV
jgi:hypothetical protein